MVTVMRGGEEVKLSKRAGSYLTLRDLIEEAGRDATRWFLIARKPDSQLTFDIDLARSQSNDNPVFYVQYAHARVCSLLRQAAEKGYTFDLANGLAHLDTLDDEHGAGAAGRTVALPGSGRDGRPRRWNRTRSRNTCANWRMPSTLGTTRSPSWWTMPNQRDARLALALAPARCWRTDWTCWALPRRRRCNG